MEFSTVEKKHNIIIISSAKNAFLSKFSLNIISILVKQIAYNLCSTFKDELNMRIIRVGGMSKNIEKESIVSGKV